MTERHIDVRYTQKPNHEDAWIAIYSGPEMPLASTIFGTAEQVEAGVIRHLRFLFPDIKDTYVLHPTYVAFDEMFPVVPPLEPQGVQP